MINGISRKNTSPKLMGREVAEMSKTINGGVQYPRERIPKTRHEGFQKRAPYPFEHYFT